MRVPTLYTLTALIALIALALGEDPEKETPRKDGAKKKAEKGDGSGFESAAILQMPGFSPMGPDLFQAIIADLESGEKKRFARAMKKLKSLQEGKKGAAAARMLFGPPLSVGGLQVQVGHRGGESMSGSFSDNGKKGTYRLKSVGKGRYELKAELRDGEEVVKKIEDQGTFAELRKKYGFLGSRGLFVATSMPPFGLDGDEVRVLHRFMSSLTPIIGVRLRPATAALRYHLELPAGGGIVVGDVMPGSRAEKIGLKKHDVLVRIDGDVVDEPAQVKKLAEDGTKIELIRRGKKRTLTTARRGESPSDG